MYSTNKIHTQFSSFSGGSAVNPLNSPAVSSCTQPAASRPPQPVTGTGGGCGLCECESCDVWTWCGVCVCDGDSCDMVCRRFPWQSCLPEQPQPFSPSPSPSSCGPHITRYREQGRVSSIIIAGYFRGVYTSWISKLLWFMELIFNRTAPMYLV